MEGQRLSIAAVRWNQLLRRHSLELREEAHGGIIKVRHLDAVGVEAPSVVWNIIRVYEAPSVVEVIIYNYN